MAGMPAGMDELLRRKYDILQQNADATTLAARAGAQLDNVRAGLLPAESKANIALTGAQVGLTNNNAKKVAKEAEVVVPLANADIFATRAQGRLYGSQATGEDQLNKLTRFRFRGLGENLGATDSVTSSSLRLGL